MRKQVVELLCRCSSTRSLHLWKPQEVIMVASSVNRYLSLTNNNAPPNKDDAQTVQGHRSRCQQTDESTVGRYSENTSCCLGSKQTTQSPTTIPTALVGTCDDNNNNTDDELEELLSGGSGACPVAGRKRREAANEEELEEIRDLTAAEGLLDKIALSVVDGVGGGSIAGNVKCNMSPRHMCVLLAHVCSASSSCV
eukprot:GHVS01100689.1.p2 GENE.GHVS01100689.1~~GHVS01100689.1.p2  ORF type:complete len:196 (+),score=51.15 GHVS01100689.1:719-1306(+)